MKHWLNTNIPLSFKQSSSDEILIFDLESDGLYDDVTKIFCIVIHDVTRNKTFTYGPDRIESALRHLDSGTVLIGHNLIFYDCIVIEKLHKGKVNFDSKEVIDTLVCSRLIWPKEKLYEEDVQKYENVPPKLRGSASLKAWGYRLADHKIDFKDFSEYSEAMAEYCRQDVLVTSKLFDLITKQGCAGSALRLEHSLARCIQRQIQTGFPFDVDAALDLVDKLNNRLEELDEQIQKAFPPKLISETFTPKANNASRGYIKGQPVVRTREEKFNPGSRQQIAERLKEKYGWVPGKFTDKGNPILDDDVLEKLPYEEAKYLAEYMLVKKRIGQIKSGNNAWLKLVNTETGCIHGNVTTNGCITGRCSHQSPNVAQTPASYSPYGKECRSLFHAPDGWTLVGVDAKALELRCLAGYLALWDGGEYAKIVVDPESDIHTYNQKMFGVATRDISKRLLYGIAYGCGSIKAGTIIDPNEKDTETLRKLGSTAIKSFMSGVPALEQLKNSLNETILNRGYLLGLDRRPLYCRSEYKALNVLLQAAGAVIMKQVVVNINKKLRDRGLVYGVHWQQHAFIHDEIQLSCIPSKKDLVVESCLESFPEAGDFFEFRCPIHGDAKTGFSWSDTH
jgi:DNA polymerase III epsilon subunit-like protein